MVTAVRVAPSFAVWSVRLEHAGARAGPLAVPGRARAAGRALRGDAAWPFPGARGCSALGGDRVGTSAPPAAVRPWYEWACCEWAAQAALPSCSSAGKRNVSELMC